MILITVSEKGQLVIPKAVRSLLGISAGTRLELKIESDGFRAYLEPARKTRNAKSCLGIANYQGQRIEVSNLDVARMVESK
jgi:AbrB family looped-hinge helix DNA binding protein